MFVPVKVSVSTKQSTLKTTLIARSLTLGHRQERTLAKHAVLSGRIVITTVPKLVFVLVIGMHAGRLCIDNMRVSQTGSPFGW